MVFGTKSYEFPEAKVRQKMRKNFSVRQGVSRSDSISLGRLFLCRQD
jgi:hypothetical protein